MGSRLVDFRKKSTPLTGTCQFLSYGGEREYLGGRRLMKNKR